MLNLVWLIPALPLLGFLTLVVFGRLLGEPRAGWFAAAMCGLSFVFGVVVFIGLMNKPVESRHFTQTLFTWLPSGGLHVSAGFLVDPLSMTMVLFVTGIGALIHIYSVGYMHGDPKFSKFFIYLNLFVFSMLMLVLGDSLLTTFLGWEGVGTCSYLLISFWFSKDANASAGKKAFVTNRIGDFGFMLAMFLVFSKLGSLQYNEILEKAGTLGKTTAAAVVVLLFVGACGKSAQLPLFVWLPDAMAGPTPVSALIHAATMVTSGVYLMVRVSPIINVASPWVLTLIAIVGAATALFAATVAVAQNDIKKVLAYSTVSQLGYMFLAIGSKAYVAAIFHMVTHAFFKANMFLGSGSVIHGMHDEQDMRRMGALRKIMPITAITFILGWLAIAGVPPLAGFFSKDEILLNAWEKSPVLWAVGLLTALLTAFYMSRQVFMVFFGKARWGHDAPADAPAEIKNLHPHESNWMMTAPLVVLAGLSLVGGAINLPFWKSSQFLDKWLEPVLEHSGMRVVGETTGFKITLALVAVAAGLIGIGLARAVYLQGKADPAKIELPIMAQGWRYDSTIAAFFGGPARKMADFTAFVIDRKGIDGAVDGIAKLASGGGQQLRKTQSGYVRNYAAYIAFGAVVLLGWFVIRAGL